MSGWLACLGVAGHCGATGNCGDAVRCFATARASIRGRFATGRARIRGRFATGPGTGTAGQSGRFGRNGIGLV